MKGVDVIVPWGGDDKHRVRAFAWVSARYEDDFPAWRIVVGEATTVPWCKADAVDDALRRSTADTIVLADADVWVDNLDRYVESVTSGRSPWACPHHRVFRFNEVGTKAIYDEDVHPADVALRRGVLDESPYPRVLGGGIVVMPRALYNEAPIDRRFRGWGGEDQSFGLALATVGGRRFQGEEMLWHLWHPPQDRLNRAVGSAASAELAERYRMAAGNVDETRALIEEGRAWASSSSS